MKNTNNEKGGLPGAKGPVTKLPKMEMYAVLGLEMSKQILEKLESVEESLEILAREKARELHEGEWPEPEQ